VYLLLLGQLFGFISVAAYFSQDEPPRQLSRLKPRVPSAVRSRRYPLLPLLGDLRGKQCARLHDRIFSVLGLVDEGQHITVDYDRSLPLLALDVLHACGPNVCLCAVLLVLQMLGVHDTNSSTDSDVDSDVGSDGPCLILPAQESADQLISAGGEDPCPYWQSTIARCYGPLAKSVKITARDQHDEDFDILCIPFSSPALAAKNGKGRRFELCDEAKSGCPATPVRIGVGSWNQREITGDASTYAQILSATLDMGAEGVFKINAFFRNLQDLREEIHARFKRLTAKTNSLYADSGPGRFEFLTQTFDSQNRFALTLSSLLRTSVDGLKKKEKKKNKKKKRRQS